MSLVPIERAWERVESARANSDTELFLELLALGEMVTKLATAGMVAALVQERDRHQYRLLHRLVRADGIGEWSTVMDDVLTGPAAQALTAPASEERRQLTQRMGADTWQYEAVSLMLNCLKEFDDIGEEISTRLDGKRWFSVFARLRNKTRGHGIRQGERWSRCCPKLEQSIRLVANNFGLFCRPWAYLHRNLSGKYRVSKLNAEASAFDPYKSRTDTNLPDGIYVYFDKPAEVDLLISDVDLVDFYFPNGGWGPKHFELISYLTGQKKEGDSSPYLLPASELPLSETRSSGRLELRGCSFTNVPPLREGYIRRPTLERELMTYLVDDRHPVVTLVGRGGIGKTWLALAVLDEIAQASDFATILWFSARDIDLGPEGPKVVKPDVLSQKDLADELVELMGPDEARVKDFNRLKYFQDTLGSGPMGRTLFVFDNFETVRSPADLYTWIDTYIRLPNKVLITTRTREFKADYPLEVSGMSEDECDKLVTDTARRLGIETLLLNQEYRRDLYRESEGHPYVVKIYLGEVAKTRRVGKVERIFASRDHILDALFERTYTGLSPAARRVFLTLCNWRSTVAQIALEAVLLRTVNERIDVESAVEELVRSSFIEVATSTQDAEAFLLVPLVALIFGRRKLAVSPLKTVIEADLELLRFFGATQQFDIRHGIRPRVERLFGTVATRIANGKASLDEMVPILEFVAGKYPEAWLRLADLYEEQSDTPRYKEALEATSRYLEAAGDDEARLRGWDRMVTGYRHSGDVQGEAHALVELASVSVASFTTISEAANRLNQLLREQTLILYPEVREILANSLCRVMEERIGEGDATDCSRLGWLCLYMHDLDKAREIVKLGLERDATNRHCLGLAARLGV